MFRMRGLGKKPVRFAAIVGVAALLGGCCSNGVRCGNRCGSGCQWPNGSIEMGITRAPWKMFQGGACNPCGNYDPCYPFAKNSGAANAANNDLGYDNSDYLSSADEADSGNGYY